jgi:sigma-B regulation protein RsbQ
VSALVRLNARLSGAGGRPIIFAHGYGCDQTAWRHVAPAFEQDHRVLCFDHVGAGGSDISAYDPHKYASLEGYARDLIELCAESGLQRPVLVAHSVGAMMGVVAERLCPGLFNGMVLMATSPCYLRDGEYDGGFSRADIDDLLRALDSNFVAWSRMMAPVIMGNPGQPALAEELSRRFCSMDLRIARDFARVAFLADCRAELPHVQPPCLVLQCSDDALAPLAVGRYMHAQLPRGELAVMQALGHCPHLSAPVETIRLIRRFVAA